MHIWIDIVAPSDVHFFSSLIRHIPNQNFNITIRNKMENIDLADLYKLNYVTVGNDHPNNYLKYLNVVSRTSNLFLNLPKFDVSMCFQNGMCSLVSKLRNAKCIMFDDNDYRVALHKSLALDLFIKAQDLADYYIVPKACYDRFDSYLSNTKLYAFDGYKEDIYISSYSANKYFVSNLPFSSYVIIRPEALDAVYVNAKSIVPQIIELLLKENINIILLPRFDRKYYLAKYQDERIFIPPKALNGLDLIYHSSAVLTGSGTLAREAACMCKPSVSFFPGHELLSVDQQLVNEGKMFHSRDPVEIAEFVLSHVSINKFPNLERSIRVRDEVIGIINKITDRCIKY